MAIGTLVKFILKNPSVLNAVAWKGNNNNMSMTLGIGAPPTQARGEVGSIA
jgi:hypothetical protein